MSAGDDAETLWLVVPPLDGPVTGGTLYNRELVAAFERAGARVRAVEPPAAVAALRREEPGWFFVDSLYLAALPTIFEAPPAPGGIGVLAHYLPSLVRNGRAGAALDAEERFALDHARAFVAPSAFLRDVLVGEGSAPAGVVEPGRAAAGLATRAVPEAEAPLEAIVIANLVPGKGVEPLLAALAAELEQEDALSLTIIGSAALDPPCATRCHAALRRSPRLAERVRFAGALPPEATLERLSRSELLISASRMESYGMALAEARTLGIPIVARRAGNTGELVSAAAGGALVDDDRALARACLELARDRRELARRAEAARQNALPPRSWDEAARELREFLRGLPAPARTAPGTPRRTSARTKR